jgi:hypothetical protein
VTTATQPKQRSYAYFESQITLHSDEAQHVAERMGQMVDDSFRNMRYGLRFATSEKTMDKLVEMIESSFTAITTDICAEMARVQKQIEDNGVVINPVHGHPATITVRNSTPMTARYFGIIQQFDQLIAGFEKLYLSGVWNDGQRYTAGRDWQRRVARVGSDINLKEQRAWAASARQDKKLVDRNRNTKKPNDISSVKAKETSTPASVSGAEEYQPLQTTDDPHQLSAASSGKPASLPVESEPVSDAVPEQDSKPARKKKTVAA